MDNECTYRKYPALTHFTDAGIYDCIHVHASHQRSIYLSNSPRRSSQVNGTYLRDRMYSTVQCANTITLATILGRRPS